MLGDDGEGFLNKLTGGSSVDTDEIWSQVRQDGKTIDRRSQQLQSKADAFRDVESKGVTDPEELADIAENGAEHAEHIAQGSKLALNARSEEAITEDESYEFIDSSQEKIDGLADDIDDAYTAVIEYGNETYDKLKDTIEQDMSLGVDVDIPANIWAEGVDVNSELRDVQTEYSQAENHFRNKARLNENEQERAEDKAEKYEEITDRLEDSPFQEEYGELADKLQEKAETDKPVTAEEKANKAEAYSALVKFTRDHIKDIQNTASKLEETRNKAYNISKGLDTVLFENGYRERE